MAKGQAFSRAAELRDFVAGELSRLSDPGRAKEMAAYMKTDMPFYGVQKPDRIPVFRAVKERFPPSGVDEYRALTLALWQAEHREEKYLALEYACRFVSKAGPGELVFFEQMVREGAWWDFVDVIAGHLVGHLLLVHRSEIAGKLDRWVDDDDMWIRRTAILSQLRHKKDTDVDRLFSYCLKRAHEKEFFIRKAIGWALREYSYSDAAAVKGFLLENRQILSPLTFKEGAKRLVKAGIMSGA